MKETVVYGVNLGKLENLVNLVEINTFFKDHSEDQMK